MNACLWCDEPTGSEDKLCRGCKAVNDYPPTACTRNPRHLPTLGPECAECHYESERRERARKANAPILASLREIRAGLIAEWHTRWPGMEFGKAILGKSIDGAIADLEKEGT